MAVPPCHFPIESEPRGWRELLWRDRHHIASHGVELAGKFLLPPALVGGVFRGAGTDDMRGAGHDPTRPVASPDDFISGQTHFLPS